MTSLRPGLEARRRDPSREVRYAWLRTVARLYDGLSHAERRHDAEALMQGTESAVASISDSRAAPDRERYLWSRSTERSVLLRGRLECDPGVPRGGPVRFTIPACKVTEGRTDETNRRRASRGSATRAESTTAISELQSIRKRRLLVVRPAMSLKSRRRAWRRQRSSTWSLAFGACALRAAAR